MNPEGERVRQFATFSTVEELKNAITSGSLSADMETDDVDLIPAEALVSLGIELCGVPPEEPTVEMHCNFPLRNN